MTRRPILGLALAALIGLSLTVPCLAMEARDDVPTEPMEGCASGETSTTDLVCATDFKPVPATHGLQPTILAVERVPATRSAILPPTDRLEQRTANPAAREHAPPTYLLHSAFLI
ncbi:MAG: hypothetical protein ACREMD_13230 [Gemmatimonadota bacterium]